MITQRFLILSFIAVLAGLYSCRTARDIPAARLKPIPADKLLNQARQNAFEFKDLTIRRINVQFQNEESKTSFRASLRATKDEKILASVSKLNIPVGRILLTPDNITYVNYIDKNYFYSDYSYLSNLLNFNLNFDVFQAVLSNPVKSNLIGSGRDYRRFDTSIEDGMYVLHQVNNPNVLVNEQKKYSVRNHRTRGDDENKELVVRKLMFNPKNFVLERMIMEDTSEDRKLEVDFSDFVKVDGYDYPGAIDMKIFSENELTELNIRLRGFSTEKVDSVELNIPDRYQQIRIR